MTKSKALRQYVRKVSRKLTCYKLTRFKLLNGLTQEISAYSTLSYEELCEKIGTPTQTAAQLMDSVGALEVSNVIKTRRLLIGLGGGLLISTALVLGIYFIKVQQIMHSGFYVIEHCVETEVKLPDDMTAEEAVEYLQKQEELKKAERHRKLEQGE